MTLSVGVVSVTGNTVAQQTELMHALQRAKSQAKSIKGHAIALVKGDSTASERRQSIA
jgi:hypothetical protein